MAKGQSVSGVSARTQLGPQEPWPRVKFCFLGHRTGSSCVVPGSLGGRGRVSPSELLGLEGQEVRRVRLGGEGRWPNPMGDIAGTQLTG